jgi:hypothetical protein
MFEKLTDKNAIKQEKGRPPRFFDNPEYPLKRIWPKPQGPFWISNYCSSTVFNLDSSGVI